MFRKIKSALFPQYVRGVWEPPEQFAIILKESLEILRKTSNPGTFFSRYNVAMKAANKLLDCPNIIVEGKPAADILVQLLEKTSITNKMIDRCFAEHKEYLFEEEYYEYIYEMSIDSVNYYKDKLKNRKKISNECDDKKYIVCKVIFYDGGKGYFYKTLDKTISKGDRVRVIANGESKIVKVIDVNTYTDNELPMPWDVMKPIEGKI